MNLIKSLPFKGKKKKTGGKVLKKQNSAQFGFEPSCVHFYTPWVFGAYLGGAIGAKQDFLRSLFGGIL